MVSSSARTPDEASGKRLDMGKSRVRFRRLDDVPLDVVGEVIARADRDRFLAHYLGTRGSSRATRSRAAS